MKLKTFKKIYLMVTVFVALTVGAAVLINNILLAIIAVMTGIIFLFIAKSKTKQVIQDERAYFVAGKAARATYIIFTLTFATLSLFLILLGRLDHAYIESLGLIFSYITLFILILYSISYYYYNKEFGASKNDK